MQTKEQIKEKVLQMIPQVAEGMTKNLDKVLENIEGVENLEKYDDDYSLPKMVLQALLKEEMFQYQILSYYSSSKKYSKNSTIDKLYALI